MDGWVGAPPPPPCGDIGGDWVFGKYVVGGPLKPPPLTGHWVVRGRWAPPPTEGKGSGKGQGQGQGQQAPPASDSNPPGRRANPRPWLSKALTTCTGARARTQSAPAVRFSVNDCVFPPKRRAHSRKEGPRPRLSGEFCRNPRGGGGWQMAHHATSSTAPAHQPLGSAKAETTPAGAPAAAADIKQRPDATCEGKNG